MDYSKLKLVIWDLDDTFWHGTISEGPIDLITENVSLIKSLTDNGIINTICSKNDYDPVKNKLQEAGIYEYFVFCSINWDPKGKRVQKLIKDMGLRAANCLFIDDNTTNLNEAKYYEPTLNIAEPCVITELKEYLSHSLPSDIQHTRLNNYKVLETKKKAQEESSDNLSFLYDSETNVELHDCCESEIDRIFELVQRTNQLNYTKRRDDKEELLSLINSEEINTGYVTVSDKYGDYGVVGFYAIKDNKCIHFLFSCRTIGQGVEQYVYSKLNYPKLDIVGEVINKVDNSPAPDWINKKKSNNISASKSNIKVIFKGACDLQIVSQYLSASNIVEEFTYVTPSNKWVEHHNNSFNYLYHPFLSQEQKETLLSECIFCDENQFNTAMYDTDTALVFVSTMMEANLGLYKNKNNGIIVAFGESCYPLTDERYWDSYINQDIFTAENHFSIEWLKEFRSKYTFEGAPTPQMILDNAKIALSKISQDARLCYFLGSETPYLDNKQENYKNRHLLYREINELFRQWAASEQRVLLIDFNDYIKGQGDFTNNINHFVRRVYFDVAAKANEYIASVTGQKAKQTSKIKMWFWSLVDMIGRTGFYQSRFWHIARIPVNQIKTMFK